MQASLESHLPPAVAHTSDVIAQLAVGSQARLSVRSIIDVLGDRIYALLIVVLAIPNCLPMPPPIPLICGLLLGFIGIQLMIGRESPWFPKMLLDRSVKRKDVERVANKAIPLFKFLEKYSRPRLVLLVEPVAHRVIGIILLLLAVALLFAPPFIGQIPIGFAICMIGLGIVERDGLIVFFGFTLGCCGASLSYSFIYVIIAWISAFF